MKFESPSARLFSLWRFTFGLFLIYYSIALIPFTEELFTTNGLNITHPFLALFPTSMLQDQFAELLLLATALVAIPFALGIKRQFCAFFLFVLLTVRLNLNWLAIGPEYPFTIWLLIICILVPPGESIKKSVSTDWRVPNSVLLVYWAGLALIYLPAGYSKISSIDPSWRNGSAIYTMLTESFLIRPIAPYLALTLPRLFLKILTWIGMLLELVGFAAILNRYTRLIWTVLFLILHSTLLDLFALEQVSLGMIVVHLFGLTAFHSSKPSGDWSRDTSSPTIS